MKFAPDPLHAEALESALVGKEPTAETFAAATDQMNLQATLGDVYASAEYRAHLTNVMAKRALIMKAAERAAG